MPGGLFAFTTSEPPSWKKVPGGIVASALTVTGLVMFVMDAKLGVTFVTAASVCPTLFTTLAKVGFTPVTHVSAEAEDKSAALMLPTPMMSRANRCRHRTLLILMPPACTADTAPRDNDGSLPGGPTEILLRKLYACCSNEATRSNKTGRCCQFRVLCERTNDPSFDLAPW